MENLQSEYTTIEKDLEHLILKPKNDRLENQYYGVQTDLLKIIRNRSLEEKLDSSEYETRLHKAFDILGELKFSLSGRSYKSDSPHWSENEQLIWFHRPADQILVVNKETEPMGDANSLQQVAADYLANPWMQINQIDWILLDSMLYTELAGNRNAFYSGKAFGEINLAYILSDGDTSKQIQKQLKISAAVFGLRYVLPPILIGILIYLNYDKSAMIIGGIYLIYFLMRLILWPARYKERKKKEKQFKYFEEILLLMCNAYNFCSPPTISPKALEKQINIATDKGIYYDGAVFSLLAQIKERNENTFLPFRKITTE